MIEQQAIGQWMELLASKAPVPGGEIGRAHV